ncbi:Glycosyltransferase involved in cell wall bisynthesis [Candidatus Methanomarinus sp.]|nr:Glycosyltransferase involved in cell wall bisynthesis [ANME-2 cluster archaeon]
MLVSIILCTYDINRYSDFIDAINSLLDQTYTNIEIVVVVDGNRDLHTKIKEYQSNVKRGIEIILNEKNLGLSESRNRGIKIAKGSIMVFFDDDAIADRDWILELVRMYEEYDAIAAGGKLIPLWVGGKMDFLPEEYYWLIGATHRGFADGITEVRNTFGSNISFKTEVLDILGGFRGEMGIKGSGALQGEETEMCERMKQRFGKGVMYNPDAVVHHKIFSGRMKIRFLLRRAFWQGYSKRAMKEMGYSMDVESDFLKKICNGILIRIKNIPRLKLVSIVQMFYLLLFTFTVFLGYSYRYINHLDEHNKQTN